MSHTKKHSQIKDSVKYINGVSQNEICDSSRKEINGVAEKEINDVSENRFNDV